MKESREETGESTIKHPVSHTHPFSLSLSLSHPLPTFSWCVSHDLASRWYNRLLGRNQNDPVRSISDLERHSHACRSAIYVQVNSPAETVHLYMYTLHIHMYMYMMTTVHIHVYTCTCVCLHCNSSCCDATDE